MAIDWSEGPLPDEPGARIIEDTYYVGSDGRVHRFTTFEMVMHRFVLAELNTHTLFSRNSESSRAVPYHVKRKRLLANPAYPLVWPAEKPGMQGGEVLSDGDVAMAAYLWNQAMAFAVTTADELTHFVDPDDPDAPTEWDTTDPLHKSLANRLLEPFMWHTATVSATDWSGFFHQRSNNWTQEAQPEIAAVATIVENLYLAGDPRLLLPGQFHTPYIRPDEKADLGIPEILKLSTARCARTSYLTHGGLRDTDADYKLYERLRTNRPGHASPFQHIATPAEWNEAHVEINPVDYGLTGDIKNYDVPIVGNARGFLQLRHIEMGF